MYIALYTYLCMKKITPLPLLGMPGGQRMSLLQQSLQHRAQVPKCYYISVTSQLRIIIGVKE